MSMSISNSNKKFIQRPNTVTGQSEWVLESEDYDYQQEIARSAYADMLHDDDRNMKYYKGLERTIRHLQAKKERIIVLDIGTGTGLLSMMAAKLGADQVYACETFQPMASCASKIIHRNGFSSQIKLIPKRSTDLIVGPDKDMTTRANVLVTEVFDTELIGEGAIDVFNHAIQNLLTEDAFIIPSSAIMYAQVVECDYITETNSIVPNLRLGDGSTLSVPKSIQECSGVPSVQDLQLGEIDRKDYVELSDPVPIFEFDWTKATPSYRSSQKQLRSKSKGKTSGIFFWWDLKMSSLVEDENDLSNTISMNPKLPAFAWRDHWMQAVYHVPKPIEIKGTNEEFVLNSYHDNYSLWFEVVNKKRNTETGGLGDVELERPICTCGLHVGLSRNQIGMFNHSIRNPSFLKLFQEIADKVPDSIFLVITEGSSLLFPLANLGAQKVYGIENNPISFRAMNQLIEYNKLGSKIQLYKSLDEVKNLKIDFVLGIPNFQSVVLPWDNLHYWYSLNKLQSSQLNSTCFSLMRKGIIRGIAVKYQDLWKIRARVGRVCNEEFDIRDFDDLIMNASDLSDSTIDAQPLWEYPAYPSSESFTVMEFNMDSKISDIESSGKIQLLDNKATTNGIALWMDWEFKAPCETSINHIVSNGPTEEIVPNKKIIWDKYARQGIYFFPKNLNSDVAISFKAKFTEADGNLSISFIIN